MKLNSVIGVRDPFTEDISSDIVEGVIRLGTPRRIAFKVTNVLAGDRLKVGILQFQEKIEMV